MQYYININQLELTNISKETGVRITLKHATILSYLSTYFQAKKLKRKIINDEVFHQIGYLTIATQNPMLEINDLDVIGKYIKDLVKTKILQKYLDKSSGNELYFGVGDNWSRIFQKIKVEDDLPANDKVAYPLTTRELPANDKVVITNQINSISKDKKDKKKSDHNFNSEEYIKNDLEVELGINLTQDLKDTLLGLMEIRKIKKTPTTKNAVNLIIKDLKKWCGDDIEKQIQILENSIKGGWTGVFEIKETPTFSKQNNKSKPSAWVKSDTPPPKIEYEIF